MVSSLSGRIVIRAMGTLRFLLVIVAGLTLASLGGQLAKYLLGHDQLRGLVRYTFVAEEGNLPTWFSAATLMVVAVLFGLIGLAASQTRRQRAPWLLLTALFTYLSLDEATALHERLVLPTRDLLRLDGAVGQVAWIVPGALVLLLLGVVLVRFLAVLPARTRRLLVGAGGLYVGGGMGVELVGGWYSSRWGYETLGWALLATVEEGLEMLGAVLLIYALLSHLARHVRDVQLRFEEDGSTPAGDRFDIDAGQVLAGGGSPPERVLTRSDRGSVRPAGRTRR